MRNLAALLVASTALALAYLAGAYTNHPSRCVSAPVNGVIATWCGDIPEPEGF